MKSVMLHMQTHRHMTVGCRSSWQSGAQPTESQWERTLTACGAMRDAWLHALWRLLQWHRRYSVAELVRLGSTSLGGARPRRHVMRDFNVVFVEVSMTTVVKNRLRAANHQGFRCYYCGLPMWEKDPTGFALRYRLTPKQALLLRCTAEHLRARCDGGDNHAENIVAACLFCNSHRHMLRRPPASTDYQVRVRRRMLQGRWLAAVVPTAVIPHRSDGSPATLRA